MNPNKIKALLFSVLLISIIFSYYEKNILPIVFMGVGTLAGPLGLIIGAIIGIALIFIIK